MKLPKTIKYRGHLYWKQEGARTVRGSDVEDVDSIINEEKERHESLKQRYEDATKNINGPNGKIAELKTRIDELESDLEEQCRLLGKSAQREAELLSRVTKLGSTVSRYREALEHYAMCEYFDGGLTAKDALKAI